MSRWFGGFETLQLEVRDVAPTGLVSRIWRAEHGGADPQVQLMPATVATAS